MTDLKAGDQAQWSWGQGHPTGTVAEVTDHGSLSIESANGNTITRNADPSNPAVRLQQDSGTEVVKRASELEKLSDSTDSDTPEESSLQTEGTLRKPFPAPRQSAPVSRPADSLQEKEEANLSLDEQQKLAEQRDGEANGGGKATIHGHANEQSPSAGSTEDEDKMDTREEEQAQGTSSPEKQPTLEASVGDKRGRSEEPASADEQPTTSTSVKSGEVEKDTPAEVAPEPETKKARVEKPTAGKDEPAGTAGSADAPKKKAGRPKKEDARPVEGVRKSSISSRTRSKANAEDVGV